MPGTFVPMPEHAHPDIAHPDIAHPDIARPDVVQRSDVARLRGALDEQRRFRLEQIANLTGSAPVDPPRAQVTVALTIAACRALADIEGALERIRTGRYGICLNCAGPIDLERLYAIPQTARCGRCQHAAQADRKG
jgi:RNA polymerase-binding transcription factor DksA